MSAYNSLIDAANEAHTAMVDLLKAYATVQEHYGLAPDTSSFYVTAKSANAALVAALAQVDIAPAQGEEATPDYKAAFESICSDMSAASALLGFDDYPGIDPILRAITDLIAVGPASAGEAKAVAACTLAMGGVASFLKLTDAGRALPPGKYDLYAAPVAQPLPPAAEPGNPLGKSNSSFDIGTDPDSDGAPKSPTHGMTLAERIEHVGGRTNDAGYIEFGSVMAVRALILQVLRDQPLPVAAEPGKSKDAERYRWLRGGSEVSTRWSRWKIEYWSGSVGWEPMQNERMDAAIDIALQAAATKEGAQP